MSEPKPPDDAWDDEPDEAQAADDGALHDPLLRRALDHAPDHAATPDAALSQSIRVLAHEAVAPSLPPGPVGAQRPWWQRLLGIGGGAGSRLPWNAAFATVLVGVLVTLMWQREPVPDAQPEAARQERQAAPLPPVRTAPAAPAPAPAPAPAASLPPAAPSATAPVPSSVLDSALAESRANTEAAKRALDERDRIRERQAREAAADRAATLAAEKAAQRAQEVLAREQAKLQAQQQLQLQPPTQWPPAMPVAPSAPATNAGTGTGAATGALRAAPSAPLPQVPPVPSPRTAGLPAPPSAASAVPSPAPDPTPTFDALSQWTQLRISHAGNSRIVPRAEAGELGALTGSAALAGVGPQPLAVGVDWRIALERNGEVLAVLELAGAQVRWREKGRPAGTGAPGAGTLSSLRQALEGAR